ncbi:hypothetical protein ACUNFD_02905 [Serratia sp. IR-2025]
MLYLIYAQDVPHSLENRLAVRPAHLARLQDPYVAAGVYADVTVKPFKQVF